MPRIWTFLVAAITLAGVNPSAAAEKATLVLDWLPGGTKAVAYVAAHEGFFAKEGLDVTIEHARGTTDALTRLATNNAQFATGGLPSLFEASAESRIPVKAILSFYSKQPDALFVTKGSPIKSLKDVIGRTIGTTTFTSSNVLWPVLLSKNGSIPKP